MICLVPAANFGTVEECLLTLCSQPSRKIDKRSGLSIKPLVVCEHHLGLDVPYLSFAAVDKFLGYYCFVHRFFSIVFYEYDDL
jgi:hypothetical protein